jgi:SAM-dependent methyltransferase
VLELTKTIVAGIPSTGPTDPIAYYRRPLVGWLFRERINRGLRLLPDKRFASALEVGYGAGAVLLALARGVDELHGLDLDADPEAVAPRLRKRGVQTELVQGSVLQAPYPDDRFELVVCFSVLEHLRDYREALAEMARVLRPGGHLLVGMPSVNLTMELGFRAIGFKGIDDHHVTTPEQVARAFDDAGLRLRKSAFLDLPHRRPLGLRLYHSWLLQKQS